MPLQATSGAASYDAFGGGVAAVPNYIEDVFSTWLYTGNSSTQTITNGIDLAGKGGLVWFKRRSLADNHWLIDTARGGTKFLISNTTGAQAGNQNYISSFNANGFTIGTGDGEINSSFSSSTYASWTFREQPKFFDVVTFSGGGGTAGYKTIAHNLGSVPGCIIVKQTNAGNNWYVYHRGLSSPATQVLFLQTTNAATTDGAFDANPTSTTFQFADFGAGSQFVAYLFAHNAGGFGLTGTDNVISCGSYTGNGSATGPVIDLGYEPQWVLTKRSDSGGTDWWMFDNMRGLTMGADGLLRANTAEAEEGNVNYINPLATGFQPTTTNSQLNANGGTYIYIAIRRGPMKVPTTGTSVFAETSRAGSNPQYTSNFPVDFVFRRATSLNNWIVTDRLRGGFELSFDRTTADDGPYSSNNFAQMTGYSWQGVPSAAANDFGWMFRRAPGFFDEVCYTGDGVNTRMLNHNLLAQPELIISKNRQAVSAWEVVKFAPSVTTTSGTNYWIQSISTSAALYVGTIDSTFGPSYSAPTSTQYPVGIVSGNSNGVNASGTNYVAYLFATCAGVSKVGSYTGNGTTQAIACGFTGGARFVLIKRTDATGDWYVYDTARGMTVLTDPYLLLNSTAAETATLGSVITSTGGFTVNAAILAAINTNAASYIFLAIA